MRLPVVIVNFKAYTQSTGKEADELAKICEKVAHETGVNIIIAVGEVDIHRLSSLVDIPIFSERMDPITQGAHTGRNLPEALMDNGASGTLINHSEDRYRIDFLLEAIERAKELGMETCVCANDPITSKALACFEPDVIAVEPPELIGGDISVSTAQPEIITNTINEVKKVADVPVLCGAGVKNGADVKKALELGAQGILVASGIVKAQDPEAALRDLVNGITGQ